MWIYTPLLKKTLLMKDSDFDLIHFVDGCYREDSTTNARLLFEHSGSWYITDISINSDISDLGASGFDIELSTSKGTVNAKKYNQGWITGFYYELDPKFYKKINGQTSYQNTYKLNLSNNTGEPYPIHPSSQSITGQDITFTRRGCEVYKSASLTGTYTWQGEGLKDDIIVGYRNYTHKALDIEGVPTVEDVLIIESDQLIEILANSWRYTYKGDTYSFDGELPLSNFTMTSGSKSLPMTYVELSSLNKDVWNIDGGAQIVD